MAWWLRTTKSQGDPVENSPPPGGTEFERLLSATPAIAEAIKKFDDPELRRAMFDSLVAALGVEREPRPTAPADLRVVEPPGDEGTNADAREVSAEQPKEAAANRSRRAKRSAGRRSWQRADVNFRPAGKQSLNEFAAERKLPTFYAKNTAYVFYLQHILGYTGIGVGHVVAAYDALGCRPPRDPENSIAKTASTTGWLDTRDMKAISTTHNGEHEVRYEMLAKKANSA